MHFTVDAVEKYYSFLLRENNNSFLGRILAPIYKRLLTSCYWESRYWPCRHYYWQRHHLLRSQRLCWDNSNCGYLCFGFPLEKVQNPSVATYNRLQERREMK